MYLSLVKIKIMWRIQVFSGPVKTGCCQLFVCFCVITVIKWSATGPRHPNKECQILRFRVFLPVVCGGCVL